MAGGCEVILLTLAFPHELKTLAFEFADDVESENVIEGHMVAITAKYDHFAIVQDAGMAVPRERSDSTDPVLAFLREGHVKSESVMG